MNHQELRDAIRNLMKLNDQQIIDIDDSEWNFDVAISSISTLEDQNIKLQAILDAHK